MDKLTPEMLMTFLAVAAVLIGFRGGTVRIAVRRQPFLVRKIRAGIRDGLP